MKLTLTVHNVEDFHELLQSLSAQNHTLAPHSLYSPRLSHWHSLAVNRRHSALMFHCLISGVTPPPPLPPQLTTPGCKGSTAGWHLHATDGEMNRTPKWMRWLMEEAQQQAHNLWKCACGTAWRIQHPHSHKRQEVRVRGSPTSIAFDGEDTSDSPSPPCSSSWFPTLLIILGPAWPTMFPHCDQSQSGSKHLSASPPQPNELYGKSRVRGSPSLGTPTPPTGLLSQSPAALHATDKHWQDSAECFLYKLVLHLLPLAGSPGTLINVKKPLAEIPASREGGGCTLLFIFRLQWTDFVRVRQRALRPRWWCRPVSRTLGSRIRLQASETRRRSAWAGSGRARRHGKRAHELTGLFSSGQETQICRNSWGTSETPWEIHTCEIWYPFHTAAFCLWEWATVWMDSVWACLHVCVHTWNTKNKLLKLCLHSLELFLNTLYWKSLKKMCSRY